MYLVPCRVLLSFNNISTDSMSWHRNATVLCPWSDNLHLVSSWILMHDAFSSTSGVRRWLLRFAR
jgi:hypothetical protein